jgi:hypothetical protein
MEEKCTPWLIPNCGPERRRQPATAQAEPSSQRRASHAVANLPVTVASAPFFALRCFSRLGRDGGPAACQGNPGARCCCQAALLCCRLIDNGPEDR